jgi:hypothetical protein
MASVDGASRANPHDGPHFDPEAAAAGPDAASAGPDPVTSRTASEPDRRGIGQGHVGGRVSSDGVDTRVLFTGMAPSEASKAGWDSDFQLHLDPELSSGLEDLVFMANAGVVPTRPATPSAGASAPDATVAANVNGIAIEKETRSVRGHEAWELGKFFPANNRSKRDAYQEFGRAEKGYDKAEQALQRATENVSRKQAALDGAVTPQAQAKAQKELDKAQRQLAQATTGEATAKARFDRAEVHLRDVFKAHAPEHAAEIDALDLRRHDVQRDFDHIKVKDVTVEAYNAIDAYSTVSREGIVAHARGDGHDLVEAKLDAADISDSKKLIFAGVSRHEGTFSEANTYDLAGITYGFIQMTTHGTGGSLGQMLAFAKETQPEAFKRDFQDFGVDIDPKRGQAQVKLTLPDGQVLRGEAAADRIATDPKYVGVLCAAGLDGDFQTAQIGFAAKKLDAAMNKDMVIETRDGKSASVKASDILTSEKGVALYFDRCVQNGEGYSISSSAAAAVDPRKPDHTGAIGQLDEIVTDYLNKHKDASLADPAVRAAIEKGYIAWCEKNYKDRSVDFSRAATEPGSYHG